MNEHNREQDLLDRVNELLADYSAPSASAAAILCDRHDPLEIACTVIQPDLSSNDMSYGELREQSERLASAFTALGVKPGDRIATLMGKSRHYLITVMAIWRLGAVHVPLFTAFAPPAIAMRATASKSKLIVCDAGQRSKLVPGDGMPDNVGWKIVNNGDADENALSLTDLLASGVAGTPAAALGGDAPLIQMYTSGTTGKPKGVVIPIKAIASFQAYLEFGLDISSEDVYWNAADPGWGYGLYYAIVAPLAAGIRTHLLDGGFSPETAYGVLSRYQVTNFAAAPTVYRALRAAPIEAPRNLKLRCASSAGEPLTPDVNQWAEISLGVPVHDHYGQTETGMTINNHHHPALKHDIKPGSMGHAMPGWSATVLKADVDEPAAPLEQGRVAIDLSRSPLAWFKYYDGEPAKTAERFRGDGRWYITGDMGSYDQDGYFYFVSRDDDIIIMSGYRIGPFEVESVLAVHDAVSECAAVAAPDPISGEVLETFVVLSTGHQPSEELTAELQVWVKKRYAAHAYPRRVHYVDSLPKTPSGKVQRFELRKRLHESRSSNQK